VTRTQRQIEEHRQGEVGILVLDAVGRPAAGVSVWAEQETHAFVFGCVAPEADRRHCEARLSEVFNRLAPPDPGAVRVDVPDGVHLGRFGRELDRLAAARRPLDVSVRGGCVGLGPGADDARERAAAERVAALYAVCFAQPAVRGIYWDGDGLLRRDFAPRPAFRYLHKLIDTVWHTRAAGVTDRDGRFRFRGFFGDYRAAARVGGESAATVRFGCRGGAGAARIRLSRGGGP
jgi:hypothetical protein